jgi:hypothetical protein
MNDDKVTQTVDEIERELAHDDPAFVRRVSRLQRRDDVTVLSVFALLATGAVLLIAGLATGSWPAWAAGLFALASSVAVDEHHKRSLRRAP